MISIHLVVAVKVVLADSVAEFYKRGPFSGRIHWDSLGSNAGLISNSTVMMA